jgi:hypothetical protein
MRYQSIRTIVRTAIAAGLVASCQGAALPASWRESLQPYAGTCFVHDLHWEQFGSFPAIRSESLELNSTSSKTSAHVLAADAAEMGAAFVPTIETDHCIAAALQFEMRTKLDAAWNSIQAQSSRVLAQKDRLFASYGIARKMVIDTVNVGSYKLVELVRIPDVLPVLTVDAGEASLVDSNSSMADWNCTDWNRDCNPITATHLPVRTQANLFVYSFDASGHFDSAGLDSLVSENQEDVAGASDRAVGADMVAANQVAEIPNSQGAGPIAPNVWQTGVDPVCPEIHLSNKAFRWSELAEQPTVCCPIDNMEYETRIVSSIASNEMAIESAQPAERPPTLDAEMTPPSSDNSAVADIDYALIDSIDVIVEPVAEMTNSESDQSKPELGAIAAQREDSERFRNWQPWGQGQYQYDGSSQRLSPMKSTGVMVAGQQPQYGQQWIDMSNTVVQWQSPEKWQGIADWVSPYFAEPQQSDIPSGYVANAPYETSIKDFGPYNPQDFIVEKVESSEGTLVLPMWYTNRLAFGIAKDMVWKPIAENSLSASKVVAKQMRSMGQLLMDMAMKIEIEADRVEIARRENNQR